MKNNLKKKIFNDFGLKILAVFFAFLLWLIVINISDYTVTRHVNDIPVVQINGDALDAQDQIYDVTSGDTVDIIIKGRRSVVDHLTAEDFKATADLSKMSITNSVQIVVEPVNKSIIDDISITCVDNMMTLSLEEKQTIHLPVKIVAQGTVAAGYAIGEMYATPNIITIEGPASTVSKITKAEVVVNVSNRNSSYEVTGDIELYDAYDENIKRDNITVSNSSVNVVVNVYPIKTVDVNVNIDGTPADGYVVSHVIYQPQSITIAGNPDILSMTSNIEINDISIDGMTDDYQTTVDLKDYLPDGVILAQDSTELVVNIDIEKIQTKTFELTTQDITLVGRNSQYKYDVYLSEGYSIVVYGTEDTLESITLDTIKPKITCTDMGQGTYYDVRLGVTEIEGIEYEYNGTIRVKISK